MRRDQSERDRIKYRIQEGYDVSWTREFDRRIFRLEQIKNAGWIARLKWVFGW